MIARLNAVRIRIGVKQWRPDVASITSVVLVAASGAILPSYVPGQAYAPGQAHPSTRLPSGLTFVSKAPASGQGVDEWDIPMGSPAPPNFSIAKVLEVQAPGCDEGPCPDTMIVVFPDGTARTIQNPAYVNQVARIGPQQVLISAGFCEIKYPSGCRIHIYALTIASKAIVMVFNGDHFTTQRALCGLSFSYRGASYTVRVIPTDQYNGVPRLTAGVTTCQNLPTG